MEQVNMAVLRERFALGADLPPELETVLAGLPGIMRGEVRDALKRALSEVEETDPRWFEVELERPSILCYRTDAVYSVGRDSWVLPQPTIEAVGKILVSLMAGAVVHPSAVMAAVWQR